eukprot:NODE_11645_length_1273_cov_10.738220.p1 GENE.NODE_11645_length_1273_cov_10.738220~~NODE_11645_length_1273_cov_10.738220.p1  ORF type:complete len:385 (-),score=50.19 NODE_11645_length_1273_cov_10.738220:16-1170(-)
MGDIEQLFEFDIAQLVSIARAAVWGHSATVPVSPAVAEPQGDDAKHTPILTRGLNTGESSESIMSEAVFSDGAASGKTRCLSSDLSKAALDEVKHLRRELALKRTQLEQLRRVVCELLSCVPLHRTASAEGPTFRRRAEPLPQPPVHSTRLRASARQLVEEISTIVRSPRRSPGASPVRSSVQSTPPQDSYRQLRSEEISPSVHKPTNSPLSSLRKLSEAWSETDLWWPDNASHRSSPQVSARAPSVTAPPPIGATAPWSPRMGGSSGGGPSWPDRGGAAAPAAPRPPEFERLGAVAPIHTRRLSTASWSPATSERMTRAEARIPAPRSPDRRVPPPGGSLLDALGQRRAVWAAAAADAGRGRLWSEPGGSARPWALFNAADRG